MKKILTLFIACAFALSAQAQKKLTEKDLLGHWTMGAMQMSMGTIDFKNQTFTISEEAKEEFEGEEIDQLGEVLLETLAYVGDYYLDFKKDNMLEHNLDGESEGPYKLVSKNGKQYLTDGEVEGDEEIEIYIADSRLHFKMIDDEDGSDIVMIFDK
ncbi:MAG: hypothetical protein V4581_13390 [Bacteroidota bacterium]